MAGWHACVPASAAAPILTSACWATCCACWTWLRGWTTCTRAATWWVPLWPCTILCGGCVVPAWHCVVKAVADRNCSCPAASFWSPSPAAASRDPLCLQVHGDLKPANCLLRSVPAYTDRRGVTVKLADFGLSRLLNPVRLKQQGWQQGRVGREIGDGRQRLGIVCPMPACKLSVPALTRPCCCPLLQDETSVHTGSTGTPGFAAPELLTDGKLTKAADIYSLGLISEFVLLCVWGLEAVYRAASSLRQPASTRWASSVSLDPLGASCRGTAIVAAAAHTTACPASAPALPALAVCQPPTTPYYDCPSPSAAQCGAWWHVPPPMRAPTRCPLYTWSRTSASARPSQRASRPPWLHSCSAAGRTNRRNGECGVGQQS